MTILRIDSPINAPTTAIVVAAPLSPAGPIPVGTSNSAATIPDAEHLPQTFEFVLKEFNPSFQAGTRTRVAVPGMADQWMEGVVTDFNSATNTLKLVVDKVSGSGVSHGGAAWLDWMLNITGEPGARGEQGQVGPAGPPGTPGGPPGERGPQGNDGEPGPDGPQGEAATISIGITTIGTDAAVTNSGTSEAAIFDFVIPGVGPQGVPGPQGLPGAVGPMGQQGSPGPPGPPGPQGEQGGLGAVMPPLTLSESGELGLSVTSPLMVDEGSGELGLDTDALSEVVSGFPAGTVMLFYQAAAPVGWTKLTDHDDKALRVVSGDGGVAGGSNAFSTVMAQTVVGNTTLSTVQMPSHAHQATQGYFIYYVLGSGTIEQASGINEIIDNVTAAVGASGAHNHTIAMAIQYCDVILASKN